MTEAQVKQKLQDDGYSNLRDLHKDAKGWSAKGTKNGKEMTVDVENTGKIQAK
jgi:hypothetical protein